ncbi:MAG: His/Gly/Thr/Pro-type tRNA ligase C-terminal domain-containing protein, partial [Oscillospiraceae bacterium]
PFKAAILPLSKKLSENARELFAQLSEDLNIDFDDAGSIGKRYRRQDEIGTPWCITYDFDTLEDNCVTIRNRDTMGQERIPMDKVQEYIMNSLKF